MNGRKRIPARDTFGAASCAAAPARDASRHGGARVAVLIVAAVVIVALVVVGLVWHGGTSRTTWPARHVILISLDTTRADHLGCYGNPWIKTPNLDALAGRSILLTDYMTVASTTLASHTSLMTGKYPHTHGVPRNGFVIDDRNVMLAEVLKAAGFTTAGFLGSFALDKRFNFAQGFDTFDERFDIVVGERHADQSQRRAARVTDAVLDYLDSAGVPGHLFLFVHYFDPHEPYDPPPPYDTMYGPRAIPMRDHPALAPGQGHPRGYLRNLRRYAGEISYTDAQIGRLLDGLRRRGILDEALVIVTSDHGEVLRPDAAYPLDHGWTTYQADIHAVGIIHPPHGRRGVRVDLPVASIDMVPTILHYLHLPIPPGVEGRALDLARLDGIAPDRVRFAEATKPWNVEAGATWFNDPKPRCVRVGTYKYIVSRYQHREELYDLARDPHERHNLFADLRPEDRRRVARMRELLQAWTADAHPLPTHFDRKFLSDTIRRLKSLGYLGGEDSAQSQPGGGPP